ncbi:DUF6522 family protein [Aquibium sp. LZ166]|uniref:DUF6522 family protein n=1 Tax=Aquibium pacificus TaxID=3153579 RepID=A0ABV3SIY5_9HYPH
MAKGLTSSASGISLDNGEVEVDAELIAKGLDLHPAEVHSELRRGTIQSICEIGTGEDSGTYRLTFRTSDRRFRIVVDQTGRVIKWGKVKFPSRANPPRGRI